MIDTVDDPLSDKNTASAIAIFTAPCNMALMACSMNCWNDRDESADNFVATFGRSLPEPELLAFEPVRIVKN